VSVEEALQDEQDCRRTHVAVISQDFEAVFYIRRRETERFGCLVDYRAPAGVDRPEVDIRPTRAVCFEHRVDETGREP
jgi:hypothetical protein